MGIAALNSLEDAYLNLEAKHNLYRFDERRKCLNTVFWRLYNNLLDAKKTMLVVQKDEELEYLNYFLSRYRIQDLALLLNEETDFVSYYTIEKFKSRKHRVSGSPAFAESKDKLNTLLMEWSDRIQSLRRERLGSISLIDAAHRLPSEGFETLAINLFKEIPYSKFKEKKALVLQADKLFRREFKFSERYSLFREEIFAEHTTESLVAILNHLKDGIDQWQLDYVNIEKQVSRHLELDTMGAMKKIRLAFEEIEKLLERQQSRASDVDKKLLGEAMDDLSKMLDVHTDLDSDPQQNMKKLRDAFAELRTKTHSRNKALLPFILSRLNPHSSTIELQDLFDEGRNLLQECLDAGIFNEVDQKYFTSFYHLRQLLREKIDLIEKGLYFLNYEKDHLQWSVFFNQLDSSDKRLIELLMEVESDWLDCFNNSYLDSFIKNEMTQIGAPSEMIDTLFDAYKDYESLAHEEIFDNFKGVNSNPEFIKSIESRARHGLSWQIFVEEYGAQILQQFPLLIVKPDFYLQHGEALKAHFEVLMTVNYLPENLPDEEWHSSFIAGYKASFLRTAVESLRSVEDLEIHNMKGVAFNVNRSSSYLNTSELNNLALYLADGIHSFNHKYRIFQMRNVSVISFLSNIKNAELLSRLEKQSVKEIIADNNNQNLLPAMFNDTSRRVIILLEDNLLNPLAKDNKLKQLLFIDQMKTAGIQILNVDNYKWLSANSDELRVAAHKIISDEPIHNSTV
jgi:hypothetical protein